MTSRDFCYFLQGFLEVSKAGGTCSISAEQLDCIQKHLNMVFVHEIDPSIATPGSEKDKVLNEIHNGQGVYHETPPSVAIMRC